MKKILAIVLVLAMAVACVACSLNRTAKTPHEKMFTYTISNETGKTVDKAYIADDNSPSKADVVFSQGGLENGAKASVSLTAVPEKDGTPNLTASYTIGDTEYQGKVYEKEGTIRLTADAEADA